MAKRVRCSDAVRLIVILCLGCGAARSPMDCPSDDPREGGFGQTKVYEYYEADGDTPAEYNKNARGSAPFTLAPGVKNAAGNTENKICYAVLRAFEDNACRVKLLRVDHRIRVTLPRWRRPRTASPAYVDWDTRSHAMLAAHEEGHVVIAEAGARAFYAEALAITSAPTCEELDRRIAALAEKSNEDTKRKQREYDETTQHGTVLP